MALTQSEIPKIPNRYGDRPILKNPCCQVTFVRWPVTVIPRVFLHSTCERETPCSHVNHVYVRTWSFTFARIWLTYERQTLRSHVKLHVRGVSRGNVEFDVRTSTICLRAHVDVSRSHVDMVDVRTSNYVPTSNSTFPLFKLYVLTWSFTCERETPRSHVDMVDVRTWRLGV